MFSAFKEEGGLVSMRRLLAFFFAIIGIVAGGYSVYTSQPWQTILVAFGTPSLFCVLLLLFTTWGDLNNTIDAVKGNRTITIEKKEE